MPYICYKCQPLNVHMRHPCQYILYMNSMQSINDKEYWYTFISHYRHMPLNKYTCHIAHVCPTTLLQSTCRPYITAHIHQKSMNCSINLPYYCKVCASFKYDPHIPQIWYMPKLLNMHLWLTNANIHATYKEVPINDVARIALQRQQLRRYLAKSVKKRMIAYAAFGLSEISQNVKSRRWIHNTSLSQCDRHCF